MSVNINWDTFEEESLNSWSRKLLNDALNSGKRPSILASNIEIKKLHFGNNAPIVEILEIGDLDSDKFRGIFKIKYTGDSYIDVTTTTQANPMNIYCNDCVQNKTEFALPDLSLVNQPFQIPINLKLSKIVLSGIIIIVFNKSKGLTLVFKNDPLENINVSSTFDAIPAIRKFLQAQIETQIRDLFREILPNVLYKISQKWTNNIHEQLLCTRDETKVAMFKDINPDGPDLSPFNFLRINTLANSRQSLSLSVPKINDFIQRSSIHKYLEQNFLEKNVSSVFYMKNILSKELSSWNSNSVPIDLFVSKDPEAIEKNLENISKYQQMSCNTKPKRRVIKINRKKKSKSKEAQNDIKPSSVVALVSDKTSSDSSVFDDNCSTLVDSEDARAITNSLRNKRALSSSSAGTEYLRSAYLEKLKQKQDSSKGKSKGKEPKEPREVKDAKDAKDTKDAKESLKGAQFVLVPKKNLRKINTNLSKDKKSLLTLSLGLGKNGFPSDKEFREDMFRGSSGLDFFTKNGRVYDVPPPYTP